MPPKSTKKKAEEQKKKIVEDKTFGLKNKKKSKKVQQYVETVKKQANQKVDGHKKRGGAGASSAASSARMAQMAARLAELELMNQPVKEKAKKMSPEEAERIRLEEEAEAERIRIANLPVEDQIEEERAKLTTRTPVTLELFLKWKEAKIQERAADVEAARVAAHKKMTRTERARLQGSTGRELFQSNAEIFVDDEEADDTDLKAGDDYIGSDDEGEDKGDAGEAADATKADPSLFGGEPDAPPPSAPGETVGVGDESLFT